MSTATENQQPPNSSSSLREVVARHPMVAFLVISFAFGWGGMLPLLLSENGPFGVLPTELLWMPFAAILSIYGLALPAFSRDSPGVERVAAIAAKYGIEIPSPRR
jgi:hypothetical protein